MRPVLPVRAHDSYGGMRMALYHVAPELTVGSAILPGDLNGVYRMDTDTIVIDRSMTYTRNAAPWCTSSCTECTETWDADTASADAV